MPAKQTQEEFIIRSKNIFGDILDYSKVNYINSWTNVILICKKHGEFIIAPKDHLCYKRGCSLCKGIIYNTQTFIEKAKLVHGDRFDYHNVQYTGIFDKVLITCKIHGDWAQTPDKHIQGRGCPKCKKSARKDLQYFIKTASAIHNNKYDYSKVIFTRMFDKVLIVCPKHGEFYQLPSNHINHKQNCPACIVGKSKKENEWLNVIKLPDDPSHRTVILHVDGRRFIVDGYDPATNTIYEFYGDFWHGNPKTYKLDDINDAMHMTYGDLYNKTMKREKELINAGYKIISIWENEYDKQTQMDRRGRR